MCKKCLFIQWQYNNTSLLCLEHSLLEKGEKSPVKGKHVELKGKDVHHYQKNNLWKVKGKKLIYVFLGKAKMIQKDIVDN